MSDNIRRDFAIQKAFKSLRPTEPKRNVARHLNTAGLLFVGFCITCPRLLRKCHQVPIPRAGYDAWNAF